MLAFVSVNVLISKPHHFAQWARKLKKLCMVIKTRTKKREILVKLKILQFDGKKTYIFFNILVLSENGRNILKSMIVLIHSI